MLCVWVHGCDPGRLSDGSRLALFQILSIECPCPISFSGMCFSCFVDVPLIFFLSSRPDHVPDWQPRLLLGMVE